MSPRKIARTPTAAVAIATPAPAMNALCLHPAAADPRERPGEKHQKPGAAAQNRLHECGDARKKRRRQEKGHPDRHSPRRVPQAVAEKEPCRQTRPHHDEHASHEHEDDEDRQPQRCERRRAVLRARRRRAFGNDDEIAPNASAVTISARNAVIAETTAVR